jgi:hypothetical protein
MGFCKSEPTYNSPNHPTVKVIMDKDNKKIIEK